MLNDNFAFITLATAALLSLSPANAAEDPCLKFNTKMTCETSQQCAWMSAQDMKHIAAAKGLTIRVIKPFCHTKFVTRGRWEDAGYDFMKQVVNPNFGWEVLR